MSSSIRVLSYNIHKGFSATGIDFTLTQIKEKLSQEKLNLVCLQEVLGRHDGHARAVSNWPVSSQFEYLSDQLWGHYSYGQNAVYDRGHHGNAILSEFPIVEAHNTDISTNRFESRGFLWARVRTPWDQRSLHVVTIHLDLLEAGRLKQVKILADHLARRISSEDPLIIAGDFNDWTGRACAYLESEMGLSEVQKTLSGSYAKTFPSVFPVLRLDRILFRNLQLVETQVLTEGWKALSDHLPLLAEFSLD